MRLKFILAICLAFPLTSYAVGTDYPTDVQKFINDHEDCDTLRGEGSDLKDWVKNTNQACEGLDKRQAQLKNKYTHKEDVVSKLNEYEILNPPKLKVCGKIKNPTTSSTHSIRNFPKDVQKFILRRDACNSSTRKIPSISQGKKAFNDWIKSNDEICSGSTDEILKNLKLKYSGHRKIEKKLNAYPLLNPEQKVQC